MASVITPLCKIHDTAIIEDGAVIGKNVTIGPYAVIKHDVELGDGCIVGPHVVIHPYTYIGKDCRFFPGASIGGEPQDLKFAGEHSSTVIETAARSVSAARSAARRAKATKPAWATISS